MTSLPPQFPYVKLPESDLYKLQWYYRKYVEEYFSEYSFGHFLLASYAAVPSLLTPDLLYKMWQNFNSYKWVGEVVSIHRVAVSDLLLSPLCKEIGFELYEMHYEIRLALLEWLKIESYNPLWKKRELRTVEEIAVFVEQYHDVPNTAGQRWGVNYIETQSLEAKSYTRPGEAAKIIFQKINTAAINESEPELLRALDTFIKTKKRLEILEDKNEPVYKLFDRQSQLMEVWKTFIQKNSESFKEKINSNSELLQLLTETNDGGIEIKVSGGIVEKLGLTESRKIIALVVGVGRFSDSIENTKKIISFLQEYNMLLNRKLQLVNVDSGFISRSEVKTSLRLFNEANDGDTCVFFYSGIGVINSRNDLVNLMFKDDTEESIQAVDEYFSLKKILLETIAKKNIHVLIIIDLRQIIFVENNQIELDSLTDITKGSAVILQNYNEKELVQSSRRRQQPFSISNHFIDSFIDLLIEGGYRLSYAELFNRLKLRMSRIEQQRPFKYAFPDNISEKTFLLAENKKEAYHRIVFDQSKGWILQAGAKEGINPSLGFMQTLLLLEDNTRIIVQDVFDNYSTLVDFKGVRSFVYKACLIQNALPKIKIAFSADINKEMKNQFLEAVKHYNIYYIQLVENSLAARFIISTKENSYLLIRPGKSTHIPQDDMPVFDYQNHVYEFIKQIEYIAQWQGVMEFDNPETLLPKNVVWFEFEKIEGVLLNEKTIDGVLGVNIIGSDPVTLHYRKVNNKWLQPALRCRAANVKRPLYIEILYLSSSYEIAYLGGLKVDQFKDKYPLNFNFQNDSYYTLPIHMEQNYINSGIKEVYEYMKFFVSEQPMDVAALKQEALKFGNAVLTRSIGGTFDIDSVSFDTTGCDWLSVTIPIKITMKEEEINAEDFKSIVEELYKQTAISTADDLQKNRWGSKSIDNGKRITAEVIKKGASNFEVIILVEAAKDQQVAFFLHNTFKNEIEYKTIVNCKASVIVNAYESFTVGAYFADGTMLELDLGETPGFPDDFYNTNVSVNFKNLVQKMYDSTPVIHKDDAQKNRWGSSDVNNGKMLSATVEKGHKKGYFNIKIVIVAVEGSGNFILDTAFFLHPTFKKPIRYKKAINGKVEISVSAYEAFVIGAYMQDGTKLELDLQRQKGYPQVFYYKENKIKSDGFYTEQAIKNLVFASSGNVTGGKLIVNAILIFKTDKQHTWLVFDNKITYVILDDEDTRKENHLIQTRFEKIKTLPIKCQDSSQSQGLKVVQFAAEETWWYYSQELFSTCESLDLAIKKNIK